MARPSPRSRASSQNVWSLRPATDLLASHGTDVIRVSAYDRRCRSDRRRGDDHVRVSLAALALPAPGAEPFEPRATPCGGIVNGLPRAPKASLNATRSRPTLAGSKAPSTPVLTQGGADVKREGQGWILFSMIVLLTAGIMRIFDGIWLVHNSNTAQAFTGGILGSSLKSYGWLYIVVGALLILVALSLMSGHSWSRV